MNGPGMVNFDVANARISGFSTFLGGVSLIALVLSINIISSRSRELTAFAYAVETLTILFLLAAIVLHFSATVALVSAYTDAARDLESSVKTARAFVGTGVVLTFLGIASLTLAAFGSTLQGLTYALAAVGGATAFVVLRARLGRPR
jgi:hypothetical protein